MPEGELMTKLLEWFANLLHSIFGKKYKVDVKEVPDQPQQPPDPIPTPEPVIKAPVITGLNLIEDGTKIRVDYESEVPVDVITGNGIKVQLGTDLATPLDIKVGSGLAASLDVQDGKFVGTIIVTLSNAGGSNSRRLDIPVPQPEPPQQPSAPAQPPQAPDLNRGFLNALRLTNRKEILLTGGDGDKYGPPHNTQGFGFNCDGSICADHGGWLYSTETGQALMRSPFMGGHTWRQWSETVPNLAYAFQNGYFYKWAIGDRAPEVICSIAHVQREFADIVEVWPGPSEGCALVNGWVHFQGRDKDSRGWHFKFSILSGAIIKLAQIDFPYSKTSKPDFGSSGYLGSFWIKAVQQGADNTKTPFWVQNSKGEVLRTKGRLSGGRVLHFSGHPCAVVNEENGKEVDGIFVINGEIYSCETGELIRFLNLPNNLSEHVGAVLGRGQKFVCWNDREGRVFITAAFGEFKSTLVGIKAKIADMYINAYADETKTLIQYMNNKNERVLVRYG